jgi:CheY-like chemotaxis protein
VVTELAAADWLVRSDRDQLKQVLINLTVNARDAMPAGGVLRIGSSTVEIGTSSQEARFFRPGRYVRLRVDDTGEGMDKVTLARIFEPLTAKDCPRSKGVADWSISPRAGLAVGGEPFFTTKGPGLRTGLGLAITHSMITQSGGYISANSEIGLGTSFEILLPCVSARKQRTETAESQVSTHTKPMPTVLLVDDDEAVRRMMSRLLERAGYQLLVAEDGQQAERVAERYPERIHVLVSDVMMPGMTGPDLAARLMPLRPGLKTLFVSGYQHDALDRLGLSIDEVNLLPKPFVAAELLRRVQALLSERI